MALRKRVRLVPPDAVEIFEIRIALYFDSDGRRQVNTVVSTPDESELETIDRVELRGALYEGSDILLETYSPNEEEA